MISQFEKLTNEDREIILKAPALVSVLASCSSDKINPSQKADAIKLAHLKTFTSMPLLIPYYTEVEKHFKEKMEETIEKFAPFDETKRNMLKKEIDRAYYLITSLDKDYAAALHKSLDDYAKHVKKAGHSIFQDFIFPLPIEGLSC